MLPQEDRATAMDNMHKKFQEFGVWFLGMHVVRQTNRHAHHKTLHPYQR